MGEWGRAKSPRGVPSAGGHPGSPGPLWCWGRWCQVTLGCWAPLGAVCPMERGGGCCVGPQPHSRGDLGPSVPGSLPLPTVGCLHGRGHEVAPTKGSPQPRSPVAPWDGTGTRGPGGPQSSALELSVPLLGWVTTAQPPVTVPISVPSAPLPPAQPGAATPHGALHLPRGARAGFHPQKSPRTHRRSLCPHHRALGKAKAFLEIPEMSGRAQQHPRG